MTRDLFISSVQVGFESFNDSRPKRQRAPNDGFRLRNMAGKAWDLHAGGRSRSEARSKLKAAFFPWWNPLLQLAWMLWGQSLVEWLLSKLFPET